MTFTTLAKKWELGFVVTVRKRVDSFLFYIPRGRGRFLRHSRSENFTRNVSGSKVGQTYHFPALQWLNTLQSAITNYIQISPLRAVRDGNEVSRLK